MATDDIKNDIELWRKLGKMEADIENVSKLVEAIGLKIDQLDMTAVIQRLAKQETDTENIEARLKKVEDNQSKIVWFVILAVVGAIIKMVIVDKVVMR